jgi:hypothetical protein
MKRLSLTLALALSLLAMVAQPARSAKRGVSENSFSNADELRALAPGVSWYYNWGVSASTSVSSVAGPESDKLVEYVPMWWGGNSNETLLRQYLTDHPGVKYLLGFNEPNFRAQANMTPQQAAELWPKLEKIAEDFNLVLVAPALNYPDGAINDGHTYQPEQWMDAFLAAYPQAKFDYVALHCYMNSPAAQLAFVENFAKKYNKKVWLTEFCAWEGTVDSITQMNTMVEKIQDLEKSEWVARYAWFKARGGESAPFYRLLVTPGLRDNPKIYGNLTGAGKLYVHLSSFDKNYYHRVGDVILAKDYVDCIGLQVMPSTDPDGIAPIQLHTFTLGSSASYQIDVPKAGDYTMLMRVTARAFIAAPKIEVKVDDEVVTTLDVEVTGMTFSADDWATREFTVPLPAGKHTITFTGKASTQCRIGWFKFNKLDGDDPTPPPTPVNPSRFDVNRDGQVSAVDISEVVNYLAGLVTE